MKTSNVGWGIRILIICITTNLLGCSIIKPRSDNPLIYKYFNVEEKNHAVIELIPILETDTPLWARNVSNDIWKWPVNDKGKDKPYFKGPMPFVIPPVEGSGEPFYAHNHQPSITWLKNGDLMAIWFSTTREAGTEMTVLASRLRPGKNEWEPSSEFFKSKDRNMTGSSLFNDGKGNVYHFNSMGPEGGKGWANLALLMRISRDNGKTWTAPEAIGPEIKGRHQVINGTFKTKNGTFIQPCDANPSASGGTALHISKDGGKTWIDPGAGKPVPKFLPGVKGEGTIAGIHAGVVELKDGKLMAFGRSDNINGQMPMSISDDMGETWTYSASPFPPISGGQRFVLMRLHEGPILLISFTHHPDIKDGGMTFTDENGKTYRGTGMFAALSYDEGKSWPVMKLITPGSGTYKGGAWTGDFQAAYNVAEPRGYLSATQTPDAVIHLISSRLYYSFNLEWLKTPAPAFGNNP